ncbi:MAG: GTP 3',8-cyclase MoaA [Deltaproteobacteria bacterium]|jgi:cyclic pyranopterin phosphate synthase|nr:GTP 3',8-cyclase MoaA [Deltaproteobacteria bacterium]
MRERAMSAKNLTDSFGRVMDYLRLAITDRCNLRCVYCMPEEEGGDPVSVLSLPRIERVLKVMGSLGVKKVKITGGEPLVHPEAAEVVRLAKKAPNVGNVTLTTNGLRLARMAKELAEAGLDAVNVSLDTLDPARFLSITRRDYLHRVLTGLDQALSLGSLAVKVNCVPTADSPIPDLLALANLAKSHDLHVRFIELMPIGLGKGQTGLDPAVLMAALAEAVGPLRPVSRQFGNGPAAYYALPGFIGKIGFISAVKSCFCERCNRVRVTADGYFKTCLHMDRGLPLPLDDEAAMAEVVVAAVRDKPAGHLFAQDDGLGEERPMSRIGG